MVIVFFLAAHVDIGILVEVFKNELFVWLQDVLDIYGIVYIYIYIRVELVFIVIESFVTQHEPGLKVFH